jgi:hypothetical protein
MFKYFLAKQTKFQESYSINIIVKNCWKQTFINLSKIIYFSDLAIIFSSDSYLSKLFKMQENYGSYFDLEEAKLIPQCPGSNEYIGNMKCLSTTIAHLKSPLGYKEIQVS